MYKATFLFLAIFFSFMAIAPAMHAACKLCEDIRERNKQNPAPSYTYYEDYLEAQGKGKEVEPKKEENNTPPKRR